MMKDYAQLISSTIPMELLMDNLFNEISGKNVSLHSVFKEINQLKLVNSQFAFHARRLYQRKFRTINIEMMHPYSDSNWQFISTRSVNLNGFVVLLNGMGILFKFLPKVLNFLVLSQGVQIKYIELFPVNRDTLGCPPFSYYGLMKPIIEIRKFINNLLKDHEKINQIAYSPEDYPPTDFCSNLTLSSSYFNNLANRLNFENGENGVFLELLNSIKQTQIDELTIILADCVCIRDPRMQSETFYVPSFQPYEVLKATIDAARPQILNIKLRTEVTESIEESYNCDWDDYPIFKTISLYSSPEFNQIINIPIGEVFNNNCVMIVDTNAAFSWDFISNPCGKQFVWRDLLSVFNVNTAIIGMNYVEDNNIKLTYQIREIISEVLTSVGNAKEVFYGKTIGVKLFISTRLRESNGISRRMLRKSMPRKIDGESYNYQYNISAYKEMFEKYSSPRLNAKYENIYGLSTCIIQDHYFSYVNLMSGIKVHFNLSEIPRFR